MLASCLASFLFTTAGNGAVVVGADVFTGSASVIVHVVEGIYCTYGAQPIKSYACDRLHSDADLDGNSSFEIQPKK